MLIVDPVQLNRPPELFISSQKRIAHVNGYRTRVKVERWCLIEGSPISARVAWCLAVIYVLTFSRSVCSRRHHVSNLNSIKRRQRISAYTATGASRELKNAVALEINDDNNGNEDHNGEVVEYIDRRCNESQRIASGSFSRVSGLSPASIFRRKGRGPTSVRARWKAQKGSI